VLSGSRLRLQLQGRLSLEQWCRACLHGFLPRIPCWPAPRTPSVPRGDCSITPGCNRRRRRRPQLQWEPRRSQWQRWRRQRVRQEAGEAPPAVEAPPAEEPALEASTLNLLQLTAATTKCCRSAEQAVGMSDISGSGVTPGGCSAASTFCWLRVQLGRPQRLASGSGKMDWQLEQACAAACACARTPCQNKV